MGAAYSRIKQAASGTEEIDQQQTQELKQEQGKESTKQVNQKIDHLDSDQESSNTETDSADQEESSSNDNDEDDERQGDGEYDLGAIARQVQQDNLIALEASSPSNPLPTSSSSSSKSTLPSLRDAVADMKRAVGWVDDKETAIMRGTKRPAQSDDEESYSGSDYVSSEDNESSDGQATYIYDVLDEIKNKRPKLIIEGEDSDEDQDQVEEQDKNEEDEAYFTLPIEQLPNEAPFSLVGTVESIIDNVIVIQANTNIDAATTSATPEDNEESKQKQQQNEPAQILDHGTIIFLPDRTALGRIFETFSSVRDPRYTLRLKTGDSKLSQIQKQTSLYYCPDPSYTNFVFTNTIRSKGYDQDENADSENEEFSDDEKEAQYKRILKDRRKGKAKAHADNDNVNDNNAHNDRNDDDYDQDEFEQGQYDEESGTRSSFNNSRGRGKRFRAKQKNRSRRDRDQAYRAYGPPNASFARGGKFARGNNMQTFNHRGARGSFASRGSSYGRGGNRGGGQQQQQQSFQQTTQAYDPAFPRPNPVSFFPFNSMPMQAQQYPSYNFMNASLQQQQQQQQQPQQNFVTPMSNAFNNPFFGNWYGQQAYNVPLNYEQGESDGDQN